MKYILIIHMRDENIMFVFNTPHERSMFKNSWINETGITIAEFTLYEVTEITIK